LPQYGRKRAKINVKGISVFNRIGLAAGLDKNAELINPMQKMGFGLVEIGTVTPKPQLGNPKPRLFRIAQKQSLLNSLGFNNKGMQYVSKKLKKRTPDIFLGANIGPNKTTPQKDFLSDYQKCVKCLGDDVDYLAINISSPNTPGLRSFHDVENFRRLIAAVLKERSLLRKIPKIFIKFSPDEEISKYEELINEINASSVEGVIISNTSNDFELKTTAKVSNLPGGISGKLLENKANEILKIFKKNLDPSKIIVAVGGVFDVDSYNKKIELGADLVQIYTGFIYQGPNLIKEIIRNGK
jgi:dihydroorotate dehydrogenase|tara:strand:+ start:405 stop:1298 length:894 start_codon:yes stop_codon:yes gene_type:complete